jgi:hypothetical protein
MRGRLTILVALATAVLAFGPAAAWAASDPAQAVQDDLAAITADLRSGQSILLPDIQALRTDAASKNSVALKRDEQKLRTDLKAILATVQKARKQLASDVGAAHAVGLNVSSNTNSKSGPIAQIKSLETQVRTALKQARGAKTKTPKTKTKTKPAHTAKHGSFVKNHQQKHSFVKHHVQKHTHTAKKTTKKHKKS